MIRSQWSAPLHLKDSLFFFTPMRFIICPLHKFPSVHSINLIDSISIGSVQKYSYHIGIAPWTLLREFTPSCQATGIGSSLKLSHIYLRYQDQYILDVKFVLYITSGTCKASIGTRLIFIPSRPYQASIGVRLVLQPHVQDWKEAGIVSSHMSQVETLILEPI